MKRTKTGAEFTTEEIDTMGECLYIALISKDLEVKQQGIEHVLNCLSIAVGGAE